MSFQSVKAAATPVIDAAISGITIKDRNQVDQVIPPLNLMPLVLLRDRASTEQPLALQWAGRNWWLECMLWNNYAPDQDQAPFDVLRETLAQTLRVHTWLEEEADDPTFGTQLLSSGRSLEMHDYPVIVVNGRLYRHCLVSTLIREVISFVPA